MKRVLTCLVAKLKRVCVHHTQVMVGTVEHSKLLKYIHTEKDISSYNEVHTYSIVITLHACGLWNMPP